MCNRHNGGGFSRRMTSSCGCISDCRGICRDNCRGMTLLELMFAAGILGLALALMFGSLVTISLASEITQNRAVVVTHISTVLEELHGLGLNQLLSYEPPVFPNLGAGHTVEVEIFLGDGSALSLPVDPASVGSVPNPLLVRCTISWIGVENRALSLQASRFYYR